MNKNQIICNQVNSVLELKNLTWFFYTKVVFLFTLFFALSVSAVAQTSKQPNYNDSTNWMCHPFLKKTDIARSQDLNVYIKNKNDLIVGIDSPQPILDTSVDIFYIYPTIDMTYNKNGNTNIDSIEVREKAQFIYREQAGIYARFGRVYAPYYRQANIGVFIMDDSTEDLKKAQADYMQTAYNDVDSAFSNYLKYHNNGRKIILIGHSQGADHMRFLLRKRFDNNPALLSQLVVAISGGEPSYVAKGRRTGGSLQNIKTLKSDSTLESGCMISWRSWKNAITNPKDTAVALDKVSFFYNHYFEDYGLIFQTAKAALHEDLNYDLGYKDRKTITRYISLGAGKDSTKYLGFDDMFTAQYVSKKNQIGNSYLLIDSIPNPNDLRTIPNKDPNDVLFPAIPIPITTAVFGKEPSHNVNYHCWDMQFVQGDLLTLIPKLIAITYPVTALPKVADFENTTLIYPNPTNGIVHVNVDQQVIKSIKLFNIQGVFIKEFFANNFSISNFPSGTYYMVSQTSKSTHTNKLIKN